MTTPDAPAEQSRGGHKPGFGVHPDRTAVRAVDACGGAYSLEEIHSGWADGHAYALAGAREAVMGADALTAELLEALRWSIRQVDPTLIETSAALEKYDAAQALISRAEGLS